VKRTVNFDDPGSYHLYYGDAVGNPGTIMTFFSWPGAPRGRIGTGQVTATSFAVPEDSLGYWTERLIQHGVRFERPEKRFDETVLAFNDPDGLAIELVARPGSDGGEHWERSPVPPEHAIRGISGVTLSERSGEATTDLLTNLLGFERVEEEVGGLPEVDAVEVEVVWDPTWTPERMSEGAREKLRLPMEQLIPLREARLRGEGA
jgi:glyoxalase family protein